MTVFSAVAVLVGVLALATVLGLVLRSRTGRAQYTTAPAAPNGSHTPDDAGSTSVGTTDRSSSTAHGLAPDEAFGHRATLVQFSTPTCARCPGTRRQLDAVAAEHDGVVRLEIDVADRPEVAARYNVLQTPTVLLVDGDGTVRTRFGGPPRRDELARALDAVLAPASSGASR